MWIPPGESSMDAVKTAGCFFGKRKAEVKDRRVFWWITFLEPNNLNGLQSRFLQNLTRDCLEWPDNINLKTYVKKNENTEVAHTAHLHILLSKNLLFIKTHPRFGYFSLSFTLPGAGFKGSPGYDFWALQQLKALGILPGFRGEEWPKGYSLAVNPCRYMADTWETGDGKMRDQITHNPNRLSNPSARCRMRWNDELNDSIEEVIVDSYMSWLCLGWFTWRWRGH